MMSLKHSSSIVAGVFTMLVLVGSGTYVDAQSRREAITARQAINCINTAVNARAGQIQNLDVDREKGRVVCEVEIITNDNREYNVYIDVANNKVIRIVRDRD